MIPDNWGDQGATSRNKFRPKWNISDTTSRSYNASSGSVAPAADNSTNEEETDDSAASGSIRWDLISPEPCGEVNEDNLSRLSAANMKLGLSLTSPVPTSKSINHVTNSSNSIVPLPFRSIAHIRRGDSPIPPLTPSWLVKASAQPRIYHRSYQRLSS